MGKVFVKLLTFCVSICRLNRLVSICIFNTLLLHPFSTDCFMYQYLFPKGNELSNSITWLVQFIFEMGEQTKSFSISSMDVCSIAEIVLSIFWICARGSCVNSFDWNIFVWNCARGSCVIGKQFSSSVKDSILGIVGVLNTLSQESILCNISSGYVRANWHI